MQQLITRDVNEKASSDLNTFPLCEDTPISFIIIHDGLKDVVVNRNCLLYTSDAADDMQCVDLGGRRIIKKVGRGPLWTCHQRWL